MKKNTGENFLALKEIRYNNPVVGKTVKEKDKSIDSIVSELTIIKEHLRHSNVVRYYRTFKESESLLHFMDESLHPYMTVTGVNLFQPQE